MRALRVHRLTRAVRQPDGGVLAVVKDVSFLLIPGTVLGITGPGGSGRHSLLRLLAGLDPRSAGEVELLPRPGDPPDPPDRAVFRQRVVLASALEPLIERGLPSLVARLARLAATRARGVRIGGEAAIRSEAAIPLDRSTRDLSPAERVRVAFAVGAALRPDHLLVEVRRPAWTAAERGQFAAQVRRATAEGPGVLLATQDELLLAALAAKVLVVEDGEVLAEGSPAEIIPAAVARLRSAEPDP